MSEEKHASSTASVHSTRSGTQPDLEKHGIEKDNNAIKDDLERNPYSSDLKRASATDENNGYGPAVTSQVKQVPDEDEFVEGGFWGWSTVIGSMLLQFSGFGYANAFGVYQDYYVREFLTTKTSSQISWIGSVQVFFTMGFGLFAGRLFDRGYFRHMEIAGCILIVFSLFMLSLAKPEKYYQVFLSQGVGLGLGSGLTYIPTLSIVHHYFRKHRAIGMGIVAAGSSLGGLLHPIMLNNLFHGNLGFARGVRASAGMVCGVQIIAILMTRPRYPKIPISPGAPVPISLLHALMKFSRDSKYMLTVIAMSLYAQGLFFPLFYLQLNSLEHGLDRTFSFYSLTILNGASVVGRLSPGFLAHSFGVLNMIVGCEVICVALIFSMLGVKTVGGVAVFAILYGFISGAMISLLAPNLALLADHPSEIGARMGICFAFTGVGFLIGNPINGALLSTSFIWWRPIVYSGVVCIAGTLAHLLSYMALIRQRRKADEEN